MRNAFAKGAVVIAATACLGVTGATAAMASTHPHNGGIVKNTSQNCGTYCDEIYSAQLGDAAGDPTLNAYIPGQSGNPGSGGQDINMRYAANTDPNEDFALQSAGTVGTLCKSNANPGGQLNSSSVPCRDYATATAYQIAFVPNGDTTGYCLGTSGTPGAGVTLQATLRKCGSTEGTLFIATSATGSGTSFNTPAAGTDYAYVSGATSTYSDPDVLTLNAGTTVPANLIDVTQEHVYGYGSGTPSVESTQQFSYSTTAPPT